ncbi:MAG: GNAT family N-acetyltransferase [Bacilli bacterium]
MIKIEKVTERNMEQLHSLKLHTHQQDWIETIDECLEEAAQSPNWCPVALYDNEVLIGFAMYGRFADEGINGRVWFDRLLIDAAVQGKGYGRACARLLLLRIFESYQDDIVHLSVYEENEAAIKLYESIGFRFTGEVDTKGEKMMTIHRSEWKGMGF